MTVVYISPPLCQLGNVSQKGRYLRGRRGGEQSAAPLKDASQNSFLIPTSQKVVELRVRVCILAGELKNNPLDLIERDLVVAPIV